MVLHRRASGTWVQSGLCLEQLLREARGPGEGGGSASPE